VNPVSEFPAACSGVSEHNWDNLWIDDSSRLAARRVNASIRRLFKTFIMKTRKIDFWKIVVFLIIIFPKQDICAQSTQEEMRDQVPEAVTTSGQFERVIVVRMKQGADILSGLKSAVEKENIKNAVILSGIGSLVSYHIHVVDNNTFPTENVFIKNDTPVDLTSVNGYVFDGRVHAHINISDERLALGGHLESGNEVFTFAIITIGVFNDEVILARFDDKNWR